MKIKDPETEMVFQTSQLCKLLGVLEDEEWRYAKIPYVFRIHNGFREFRQETSNLWHICTNEHQLISMICHPECIRRAVSLSERELAICHAVPGVQWINLDAGNDFVKLWGKEPIRDENGSYLVDENSNVTVLATVTRELFPSVLPGTPVYVEEDESIQFCN